VASTTVVTLPPGYIYAPPKSNTSGMAIASLVLGITWMWGLGSVLAVIFGILARREIKRSGGQQTGGGMALAGTILGVVGIVGVALLVLLSVLAASVHTGPPTS
jgi:hypothetical protein